MDIIIGKTPYVKKDPEKKPAYDTTDKKKERRRNRRDRRKSVRGDVIVSISVPNDRRMHPERRRG
ncbi:MAG: hypothetical protein BM485_16895 [Desulfobulbaceae bacterium DB1]|nr:MAG: hypothetical protein BM485_16895 [Desulfobulbaceae bacterium DB1]